MESEMSASYDSGEAHGTRGIASGRLHDSDGFTARPTVELLTKSEGRVLLAGLALAAGFLCWLGFEIITSPSRSHALLLVTLLTATLGRPTAIEVGYAMKLPSLVLFGIAVTVETAISLIFYPLVAIGCQHLVAAKPVRNVFRRIVDAAESHKASIRHYGPIGLFVFVLVVPYGSPIGAVIGFLLRMPIWLNLTTVLVGTFVATFLWTVFLHHIHAFVSSYGPYATLLLVVVVIVIAVAGHFTHRATRSRGLKS
jgi:hypothetical protein